ncbi:MAG TPA: hypothetical protein VKT29_05225 [Terriglobales bacterium]|nr:hypothetical protein [Terriglobales bacterium]
MKRILGLFVILAMIAVVPALYAQEERGEVGVYGDFTRLTPAGNTNFTGLGGRAAFNVNNHLQFEGSIGYDFARNFTSTSSNGLSTSFGTSRLRLLNGLFGPKIQTGVGPVTAYVVLKGGFLNFGVSRSGATTGFVNSFGNVLNGDTNGVFYPGAGVEFFIGHVFGLRAEAGDMMYFDNGANHNLNVTFGPTFRF